MSNQLNRKPRKQGETASSKILAALQDLGPLSSAQLLDQLLVNPNTLYLRLNSLEREGKIVWERGTGQPGKVYLKE